MTWGEFKQACDEAGLQNTDRLWFVGCHPVDGQKALYLVRHDALGYSISDPPYGLKELSTLPMGDAGEVMLEASPAEMELIASRPLSS